MNRDKIWSKVLSPNEVVKYEFTIGERHVKFGLALSSPFFLLSIAVLFLDLTLSALFFIVFLTILFYYGFYLRAANVYVFTSKRVLVHRGWLSTSLVSIDYDKITDVLVQETFFDRVIFNTGHLVINTAGTGTHEVELRNIESPYLAKKNLDMLKDATFT